MSISTVIDQNTVYEVTLANGTVQWVPKDPENADYVRIQQWVAAGGVIA